MKIVMWDIDVKDYLHAYGSTPELQLTAFLNDMNQGGSLTVMHYLDQSTVTYLRPMIQAAKQAGKRFVTVDECVGQ